MRAQPPALLPLLRSRVQGSILAATYLSPEREYTVNELAQLAEATTKATSTEVTRLVTSGLLEDRRFGNTRLVKRGQASPLTRPLTELMVATFGPLPVLADELTPVSGIRHAYIYGSWAARYEGENGPPPNDVDVIVVGNPDLDELDDAARAAQRRLGREVNVRRVRPSTWDSPDTDNSFLRTIRSRPMVEIDLPKGNNA
jgi:predicted nucleotidyltransferase